MSRPDAIHYWCFDCLVGFSSSAMLIDHQDTVHSLGRQIVRLSEALQRVPIYSFGCGEGVIRSDRGPKVGS